MPRFEELRDAAAQEDPTLAAPIAGELISTEIEIRSGRGEDLHDAIARQRDLRRRLFALARSRGIALGSTARIPGPTTASSTTSTPSTTAASSTACSTSARRNNTFSLHVHVGVQRRRPRGAHVRPAAPGPAGAARVSANSPFLDGRDAGLHSARTKTFTRTFPRCGVPDAYGSWAAYRDYLDLLVRTRSIVEYTQVWWSVRPHFAFGTVEVRICDAQSTAAESEALAALIVACVAQAARDDDEGVPFEDPAGRLIEENLWRAIRHGMDGNLIDLDAGIEIPAARRRRAPAGVDGAGPRRAAASRRRAPRAPNGAQRQRAALVPRAQISERSTLPPCARRPTTYVRPQR